MSAREIGVRGSHQPPYSGDTNGAHVDPPAERAELEAAYGVLARLLGRAQVAGLRLETPDLLALERAEVDELVGLHGFPTRAAQRLHAALELSRRLRELSRPARPSVRSPRGVQRLLGPAVRGLEREHFYVLLLDGKHGLRRQELVSVGTLTTSLVHPREVFRPAVREAAAAIVCAHNHPSGDPEPSGEDLEVTRRLLDAGRLLGIPLLDHVVLGDERAVSLRERMGF